MQSCKCPECGAELEIKDDNRDFLFCQYCGTKIMLDNYRSTQRIIDEARIKEAETQRDIQMKEMEYSHSSEQYNSQLKTILTKVWVGLIILVAVMAVIRYFKEPYSGGSFVTLLFVGLPVVIGGPWVIKRVTGDVTDGGDGMGFGRTRIIFPLVPIKGSNYILLRSELEKVGFKNITTECLHDVTHAISLRNNNVESVTVNGKKVKAGGKAYSPNAKIVIRYHGR